MLRKYLILDCNYLSHRAKYVFGELRDKGSATGVIYGFLKDILSLQERFNANRFIFCWDYGINKRKKLYPPYKNNRQVKDKDEDEIAFDEAFQKQMKLLRTSYLHTIGYRNIFYQDGYEADDMIAATCQALVSDLEGGVIVSADHDLFQLLRKNISWYNPQRKELITSGKFQVKYGIRPRQWAKVKAISGCSSDCVQGVPGVGDITAIKYLRHELKLESKAYLSIKANWQNVVLRNRPLVELPLKGTNPIRIEKDNVTQEGWNTITKKLHMRSIRHTNILNVYSTIAEQAAERLQKNNP